MKHLLKMIGVGPRGVTFQDGEEPATNHCDPEPGLFSKNSITHATHDHLSDFITVSGNKYKHFYFIAARFKRPLIILKNFGNPVDIPSNTCILVESLSSVYKIQISKPTMFISASNNFGGNATEKQILLAYFSQFSIRFHAFDKRTLYIISTTNPFSSFWNRAKKGVAYKALVKLISSCLLYDSEFTHETAALMRHFKRNNDDITSFNTWYALAHNLSVIRTKKIFNRLPCAYFGKQLFKIMKRSEKYVLPSNHPPSDFYLCQITLQESVPVGVAFRLVADKVEYVSVMIVSFRKEWYLDTQRMACCLDSYSERPAVCRNWLPLFKDLKTWQNYGLLYYTSDLRLNTARLVAVLDWLSIQTSEPYRHMKNDFMQIHKILTGINKSRWS